MRETTAVYKYGRYTSAEGRKVHTRCVRDLAQLQVYHLIHCLRAGDRPGECVPHPPAGRTLVEFAAAAWTPFHSQYLRDRTVSGHHREPRWLAFADELEQMLARGTATPLAELAGEVYDALVEPLIAEALEKDRQTWEEPCPFGAFRYDAHDGYVALHFHNCYMPCSPFEDPRRLVESLQGIINDIAERKLTIARIGVDSWINWLRPFQALFPEAFAQSMIPTTPDNKGGNGWWGQFIQRSGALNEERANRLRATRRFDRVRTHGECDYDAFRRHIERLGSCG